MAFGVARWLTALTGFLSLDCTMRCITRPLLRFSQGASICGLDRKLK